MELDLHGKRKYKLSGGSTPSPTEEQGNFYRNLAFSSSSVDNGTSKRVSAINFDGDHYNPENDEVFVISHSDNAVISQKAKDKRVESARTGEETPSKTQTRKICYIIICIVVVLGLLAGIAVIVVLYVLDLDKPSDVTTQSTISTSTQRYVVLDSNIKLKNEWSDDLYNSSSDLYKTLSQNYTQEIDNLLQNSNVSQYYLGVTVLGYSPGSILVYSEISFSPDIFSDSVFIDDIELADSLEDIIILESSLGKTSLQIDTSEVYFSDKCAVLDLSVCSSFYSATSFPNFFNHKSYVTAVTYFQNNFQRIIDSDCSSVASLFLCGLTFPYCQKAKQFMPCKSVCDQYNKDCSSQFGQISCGGLVDSNDPSRCLTIPATTVKPTTTTSETTTTQPETTTTTAETTTTTAETTTTDETTTAETTTTSAETTTTTAETTTTSVETTTTATIKPPTTTSGGLCEDVKADVCRRLGLTKTTFPNFYNQESQDKALETFNKYINGSCSDNATLFICTSFFPRCVEGTRENPCKDLCLAAVQECGGGKLLIANEDSCNQSLFYPDKYCVHPLPAQTTPSPPVTTSPPELCYKVEYAECQQFSNFTYFPNLLNNEDHATAVQSMTAFQGIISTECSSHALNFFCSATFLHCEEGLPKKPCRSLCEVVVNECQLPAEVFQCSQLPETDCVSIISPLQNCTESGQETCPDGSCIMKEWLCDGEADCSDNWDEMNCSRCSKDQFTCLDGTCVAQNEQCNTVPACPDHSDERDCVHLNEMVPGVLMIAYKDYHIPLCYESWHENIGMYTCTSLLGNEDYTNSSSQVYPSATYAHIVFQEEPGTYTSPFGYILPKSTCKNNQVVSLQCVPKGCGQKLIGGGMVGYIVNGYDATPGAWPWQASLELQADNFRKHLCGSVLISPNFVLTATHCINEYSDITLYRVILGATNRKTLGTAAKTYEVERVVRFNKTWFSFQPGDITLIQLKETVQYTPYIQPICLPKESEPTPTTAICYGTGWGKLTGDPDGGFSDNLQELKLQLWNTEKCNSSKAWNGLIANGYICAGYESGVRSMCSGDSGGPMVCKDNQNNWYLKGIASYVSNYCNMTNRPNVFTDVHAYLGWINNNTECVFKCKNGKCIYDKQLLCNREDNCGDNSDEIDQCDVSVNCTFDDQFVCGYGIQGFQQRRPELDSQSPTTLPSYDHTFGRYPGYFMAVTSADGRLTTPKFTVSGSACVRFFYNLRGDLNAGLNVRLYAYSGNTQQPGQQVWTSGQGVFTDKWRLGHFDLSVGVYEVVFISSDTLQVAIDDVSLHDGMCSQSVCRSDEYKCTAERDTCISHNSLCNVIKDCHSDELNCSYDKTHYTCPFENNVLCGIQQETVDNGEWLIVNQTYLQKIFYDQSFPDHTTGTDQGYMLFLLVNLLLQSEFVSMMMDVTLQQKDFCLTFWYRSQTEATFKVDIKSNGNIQNLWSFTNRTTKDWTKGQIQLPPVGDATISFTVVRLTPIKHSYKPYLALDDMEIRSGVCPQYVCPDKWTKCGNENYCFSPEERCDRHVQCSDETDEINCDCTPDEFKCGNGRCIPLSQKCDLVQQCLDGSDEGVSCDALKSVSCDFESPYLCGYTAVTNSSKTNEYKWLRNAGKTPSTYTGPNFDHTTGTELGHYMYAEGNDGEKGDQSRLESITFTTKPQQSLNFYYHMYFTGYTLTNGLQVAYKEESSDFENIIWFHNESTGEPWRSACVDLPANQNLSIVFIANRYPYLVQEADIAVDDITLKDQSCGAHSPDMTSEAMSSTVSPSTTTKSTGCSNEEFQCNNGMCLPLQDRCDGISDCINGEDELNCPSRK